MLKVFKVDHHMCSKHHFYKPEVGFVTCSGTRHTGDSLERDQKSRKSHQVTIQLKGGGGWVAARTT